MIPKDTVLIAWNHSRGLNADKVVELKVFLWNEEEIKKYDRLHKRQDPYSAYMCTDGSCCQGWTELTVDELTCICWRILLNAPLLNKKETLMEFSKIEELEALRRMCFRQYFGVEYGGDYNQYLDDYFEKKEEIK